jgi:hypothetical protein
MNLSIFQGRTLWQSVAACALWCLGAHFGLPIPPDVLIAAVGGIGLKETARRFAERPTGEKPAGS